MIKNKFVFAVSFVAMMTVCSAWATDPANTSSTSDTVATVHDVYTALSPTSNSDGKNSGIAGVTYVNRMVNSAGSAAQAAEAHAAASGASALAAAASAAEAKQSAATANNALSGKQDTLVPNTNITGAGSVSVSKGEDGVITISGTDKDTKYTLPNATTSTKGGVIVGTNISVSNGKISVANASATAKGVGKLYTGTGNNTDGSMTQNAITSALAGKFANTSDVKKAIVTTDSEGKVAPVVISDKGNGTYITDVTVTDSGAVELSRGTPTAVNNATLTIKQNGTEVGTFTANASSNKSINITVPTGSLASKSTIADADVASDAAIAQSKIANLTTDLAAKEVVANKLKSTDTTAISEANKDTLYPTYAKTAAMIDAAIDTDIKALDKSDAAVAGQYVSSVSETDGVISVMRANLPTVNNATLTIQKNGIDVATFTANSSSGATANITVPTKVSELTNDSNYATKSELPTVNNAILTIQKNGTDVATFTANSSSGATANITVPTKVSELTNDSNYATKSELPTVNNATLTIKNGATDDDIVTFTANASSGATATIPAATASVAGLAKYGQIPSGSATSTEYATIWVE